MTGNTKKEQSGANHSQSYLWQGNSAVREGNYRESINLFNLALNQTPELRSTILFNIAIAEKRIGELKTENLKNKEDKKIVIYTCNFGDYETVKEPLCTDPTAEYIIFTDKKNVTSKNWKVITIDEKQKDPRRTSRLAKIMPHKYLPAHDISVYIDSSLEIKTSDIHKMVDECLEGKDIALYKHYRRNCVYDEIEFVMNSVDRVVEDKDLCIKAIKKYEDINYPKDNGLYENGFIVRRNTKKMQEFSELWWKEYISGTERDQFTFMYAAWLAKVKPNSIKHGKQVRVNGYVNFYKHEYRSHSVNQKNKVVPYIFIAYAPKSYGMNLGRCYNEYMERLGDDEFALFIDHDAMFVSDSWIDIVNDMSLNHANEVALFIARTNRINNPYQRLNLLENNHRIEDHKIFAAELYKKYSCTTTECAQLPSSSGVILMLSKKTWKSHKFSDGFLKVDNNMHISHRGSGDPVHMMNGLHVYHFYRADNDMSHVIRDIPLVREEDTKSSLGHVIKNFIYTTSPSYTEIERYMKTLNEGEYGIFLPEQSMFCNKNWYTKIAELIEQDRSIGLLIFNDNDLDINSPFGLDALEHKLYSSNMIERDIVSLSRTDLNAYTKENRAFLVSKKAWKEVKANFDLAPTVNELFDAAIKASQKSQFIPYIYVFNSKIDNRVNRANKYLNGQLNIAMFTMGFWPAQAGMEMMVHNLASQSTKAGDNVVLFAPKPKTDFEEIKRNYIIRRFKDFEDMKRMLRQHHASMPFDVLYVQGAYEPASIALELKRELGIPVVLRTHGEDIQIDESSNYGYRLDPKKNKIIVDNIRNVNHNVFIGQHVIKDVRDITDGPISLIFNGVDTEHFSPGSEKVIHERLGLSLEQKVLLVVGRNVKKKSLHLALDALALIKEKFPNVVLVHVGKEGNNVNLAEYAKNRNLLGSFFQLGAINYFDMPSIYRSADMFVFPSKTETFGNVTVEAMSSGLPCVEFDYEVNRDKIIDGVTGFIVRYGDCETLAEKILLLLNDQTLSESMSLAGRKYAINKFSWKIVREQYKQIFTSALNERYAP